MVRLAAVTVVGSDGKILVRGSYKRNLLRELAFTMANAILLP